MLQAGQTLGAYRIETMLGRGAMGVVYRGIGISDGQPVAIKTVRTDLLAGPEREAILGRFRQEAYIGLRLRHPRIVRVLDYGEQHETLYLAMELVAGQELGRLLEHGPELPLSLRLAILLQLLNALAYIHGRGVIHRDIKPANVLVRPDYSIMLTDFGIAHVGGSELTRIGDLLGTPLYMAPEQLRGEPLDHRADLFSTGVVLYILLTERKPFAADSVAAIMRQVLYEDPPPLSTLNPALPPIFDLVAHRALAKDRARRFASAFDFAAALRQARADTLAATVTASHRWSPRPAIPPAEPDLDPTVVVATLTVLTARLEAWARDCLTERATQHRLDRIAAGLEAWFAAAEQSAPPTEATPDTPERQRLRRLCAGEPLAALAALIERDAPLPGRPLRNARGDWLELIRLFVRFRSTGCRLGEKQTVDMARIRILQQLTGAFLDYARTLNQLLFADENPQLARISADFLRLDVLRLALAELEADVEERGVRQTLLLFANQVMGKVNTLIRRFLDQRDPLARFEVASLLVEIEELIVLAERLVEQGEAATVATASPGGAVVVEFVDNVHKLSGLLGQELVQQIQQETQTGSTEEAGRDQSLFIGRLRQLGLLYRLATCLEADAPGPSLRELVADTHRLLDDLTDQLLAAARAPVDPERPMTTDRSWARLSVIAELAERFGWPELRQRVLLAIRGRVAPV